jgi:hypothetical protein
LEQRKEAEKNGKKFKSTTKDKGNGMGMKD